MYFIVEIWTIFVMFVEFFMTDCSIVVVRYTNWLTHDKNESVFLFYENTCRFRRTHSLTYAKQVLARPRSTIRIGSYLCIRHDVDRILLVFSARILLDLCLIISHLL